MGDLSFASLSEDLVIILVLELDRFLDFVDDWVIVVAGVANELEVVVGLLDQQNRVAERTKEHFGFLILVEVWVSESACSSI